MTSDLQVLAMPVIDPGKRRIEMTMPHGARISDIVAEVLPLASMDERRAILRVSIGGHQIDPRFWHARPRPGHLIVVRVVPGNALRSVLAIVVTIAATIVAPYLGGLVAAGLGIGSAAGIGLTTALVGAGLAMGGNLLLNALVPPPKADDNGSNSPTYDVKGWRNVANPDGPIPAMLGAHRQAPIHSAGQYTEVRGADQYVVARLCFGYGPLQIENIRIGETPIEDFKVEMEVRNGWPGDAPITIHARQVLEEQLSISLDDTSRQVRRTQPDVTAISIDITAPSGFYIQNDKGGRQWYAQIVLIEQRLYGTEEWQTVTQMGIVANQSAPLRRTHYWTVDERGRYEVGVTRAMPPIDDGKRADQLQWTALRGHRPEPPVTFTRTPLAEISLRVRASGRLNGVLDQLTADVTRICPDWDRATRTWITRATRNPASLARWVLQGPAAARPKADDELNLPQFQDWHEFCADKGLFYDRVHDYEATQPDVLKMVAAAGRASLRDDGRRIGVIIDRPRSQIVAAITPRTARNFRWSRTYFRPPHAYRCAFKDRTDDYADKEMVVRWPGYDGPINLTESVDMPGVADPDQLWRAMRRRQLELIYRPDTYSAEQDIESLESTRGDLVLVAHDVIDEAHMSGRVRRVEGRLVEISERVTMESGRDYAVRFRRADMTTFVRRVVTASGETDLLELDGDGAEPRLGDLFIFGFHGRESREAIVNRIERAEDFAGTLIMLPHAPEIDAILDATAVPPWDGRAGTPVPPDTTPPPAPALDVVSGEAASDGSGVLRVVVTLSRAAGSGVDLGSYNLWHRLAGSEAWATVESPASSGVIVLTGYPAGERIELQAQGVSRAGIAGAVSTIHSHVVGAHDPVVPGITAFNVTTLDNGLRRFTWTIAPHEDDGTLASLITTRIRHGLGAISTWADLSPLHTGVLSASPWDTADPTGAGTYTFGIVAVDSDGRESAPVLIQRTFAAAPALPVPPAPTLDMPTVSGSTVSLSGTTPNSAAVASVRFWRAPSGGGFADAVNIGGTIYAAPNSSVALGDPARPAGVWSYWMTAHNTAGDASPAAGPRSVTVDE